MPNINYGIGGNSLNAAQGFDAVSALMNGFFGSPQQMNANRQFGISEGHLDVDRQKQYFTQGNAIALGERFKEGLPKKSNGFVDAGALPLPEGATAGELSSLASLLGSANREAETKLTLSPWNYAANVFSETGGDPTKLRLGSEAINYADSLASERQRRELANKNDAEKQMFAVPNINSGQPQLIDAIFTGPGTPEEKAARLQVQKDFARSSGASGGYSPEQKAAGENQRDVLGLTTPVSPAEGSVTQRLSDIKTNASLAEIMAKASTADINTPQGRLAILSAQDNLTARQQIDEETNQKIREEEAKAQFASRYGSVSTEAGYKAQMAREAGIPALEQYATEVKPLILPEGGSAVIPKGSYLERNFKPSADAVAASKQAQETLMSMTKEEIAGLPKDQLVKLKQTIDAGKNAFPTPMQPENISGRFPTKAEAPKAGQLTYDGSIVSSSKLDKVDPKYDIEFDKLLDAYDGVNRALEAVKKNPSAFGSHFGMASGMPYFGNMAKNALLAEGETKARSAVFDATATKKHDIYGAALTGGEQIDANNFLPASSDGPKEVKEKLEGLQAQLYTVIERRMDTFHPFNGSHFLKSYESGRKMIDPASMTRAQEKNGARIPQRKD